jgi:protein TonB
MFERSLVISQENHVSAGQRWTALASITVQVALAGALIALPLLHPESMPFRSDAPKALLPNLKVPRVKPVTVERSAANAASTNIAVPVQSNPFTAPSQIPRGISKDDGPPVQNFTGMGDPRGVPGLLAGLGDAPVRAVTVAPVRSSGKVLHVSSGVSTGMLMAPIRPVYPAIAKATHTEGTVVVEAVISKAGLIESARGQWAGDAAACSDGGDPVGAVSALQIERRAYRGADDDYG